MRNAPDTMRVARLYRWGDVRVEEVPTPTIGPDEALVRIEACGLCGSDALVWYVESKAPTVLGHEPAGVVVDVGDDVRSVRPGDRVFVHHHAPCAECEECRRGLWSNCATWRATKLDPGGFSEYARVMAANLERDTLLLPDDMDYETATFIEPTACCIRAIRRHGHVESGDAVLIVGLGAMGLLMVQLARVYGAGRVMGSDYLRDRRRSARELGADIVLDAADDGLADSVRRMTNGRGADVIIVCPGDPRAVRTAVDAAAPGARVVCFTPFPPGSSLPLDLNTLYFREITLAQSYSCGPDETREALRLFREHCVRVAPLVTHRAGLDGVADALERARGKGGGLKTIVLPHR
jgi:L-iditol 2-dehydrogenase